MEEEVAVHRCHLCPIIQDDAPREPYERIPWMNLQCGHRIHTNCFLEKMYSEEISPIRFSCPICQEHALTNHMVVWLQTNAENNFHSPQSLQKFWEDSSEFREDIKNLSKIQRANSASIREHMKECTNIKREWNETIYASVEFIRLQRKEFTKRLQNLPSRTKAIRAINKIITTRRQLVAKYASFNWYDFSRIHRITGAPKLKKYPRFGRWLFSAQRLFRADLHTGLRRRV